MLRCSPRCRTGVWREDPAEEEERPADLCRLINLLCRLINLCCALPLAGYGRNEDKAAKGRAATRP
jgi:hypothetical protein